MNNLLQTFSKPFPKIIVKNITTTEIEKIMKCLKPSNSHGYDEISTKILPLFKKGDKSDISNYRLISLLTSFSKIFEKIIYERL
jgi:hypothetical protein